MFTKVSGYRLLTREALIGAAIRQSDARPSESGLLKVRERVCETV